jgi:hypothetical protein
MPQSLGADLDAPLTAPGTFASAAVLDKQPTGGRGKTMSRAERRRTPRQACDLTSACVVISLVEPVLLPVRVKDLSQTGVGLIMTARVAPGAFLAVKIQGRRQKTPQVIRARVIHATYQQDARAYLIGCYFVEPLRKEELALLV